VATVPHEPTHTHTHKRNGSGPAHSHNNGDQARKGCVVNGTCGASVTTHTHSPIHPPTHTGPSKTLAYTSGTHICTTTSLQHTSALCSSVSSLRRLYTPAPAVGPATHKSFLSRYADMVAPTHTAHRDHRLAGADHQRVREWTFGQAKLNSTYWFRACQRAQRVATASCKHSTVPTARGSSPLSEQQLLVSFRYQRRFLHAPRGGGSSTTQIAPKNIASSLAIAKGVSA
jgi:hypothetical protein